MDPDAARFQAGASLKVDWSTLSGSVYHYNPMTMRYELRGLLGDGTLDILEAGATPMAPVIRRARSSNTELGSGMAAI